jgi:hypothetical protein
VATTAVVRAIFRRSSITSIAHFQPLPVSRA